MGRNTLQTLLAEQDGRCFFCERALGEHDADLLFLQPLEAGGQAHDDNAVACCRQASLRLAEASLKTKVAQLRQSVAPCQAPSPARPVDARGDAPALPEAVVERLRQRQFS